MWPPPSLLVWFMAHPRKYLLNGIWHVVSQFIVSNLEKFDISHGRERLVGYRQERVNPISCLSCQPQGMRPPSCQTMWSCFCFVCLFIERGMVILMVDIPLTLSQLKLCIHYPMIQFLIMIIIQCGISLADWFIISSELWPSWLGSPWVWYAQQEGHHTVQCKQWGQQWLPTQPLSCCQLIIKLQFVT